MDLLPRPTYVKLVERPQHTSNVFGPLSDVAGKELRAIDKSTGPVDGTDKHSYLCLIPGSDPKEVKGLIDVHPFDIENVRTAEFTADELISMAVNLAKSGGKRIL